MKAVEFVGQTHIFGETAPMKNDVAEAGCLPVAHVLDPQGNKVFVSHWEVSAEELAALAAGACIRLFVVGEDHPTVALAVGEVERLP